MMIAGFDIGGTHARLRVFDEDFEVVHEERQRIRGETEPEQVAVAVTEMLMQAPELQTVGIGIAGLLSVDGRFVFNSPNLHWRDVEFASMLEERAPNHQFTIVNDLNAMLWGEHRAGAGLHPAADGRASAIRFCRVWPGCQRPASAILRRRPRNDR